MNRAIVLGGGADALVAAQVLARAGREVLVIGTAARASDDGWVPPGVLRELRLEGVKLAWPDPWLVVPLADGGRLELWRDVARSAESIRRLSARDAERWPAFCERMARLARFLEALYAAPPPDPLSAGFALRARRLGRRALTDLLRLLPMPAADLLDDWFETDALKGALGGAGILHLLQGPRSGGTAFRLLHHHAGCPPGVFRPPRSNILELLRRLPRVELQGTEVLRITVRNGAVSGVVLKDGRELAASVVVSSADPRRSLLELVEPGWLDPQLARALRHVRRRGVAARLRIEFDRPPAFAALALAPSLDYLERAYDDAKHGRLSREPYLEARCDDSHRVEALVQYAPYGADCHDLPERVVALLAEHVGDAQAQRAELSTPRELEQFEGWPEGQPHHAELALDQALWMRPLPELAHYRTPIEGLWLCGPGMHPGAGIAGASGLNCAHAILGR
ncbi:MAG TPA: NAD(P)/FAD-dependent oxidoreductase [Burkholderiales bacterium]|nr:NAD(P)/FAD-dependent oxidoreductase [Burkholderiales bacterium]